MSTLGLSKLVGEQSYQKRSDLLLGIIASIHEYHINNNALQLVCLTIFMFRLANGSEIKIHG